MEERLGDGVTPALVQPMVEPGVDVAIAVHDHPEVGPVISLAARWRERRPRPGRGGRGAPAGRRGGRRGSIARSRLAPYLDAGGHAPRCSGLLLQIGALVEEVPEIVGLRANPVIVTADRAVAIEAGVDVAAVEREPPPADPPV